MQTIQQLIEKHGAQLQEMLKDPVFFINEIIGFPRKPHKLTSYQEEWIRLLETHDRLNLQCFRTGGKTEALLVDYPIFKAFTQAGWQGIVTSKSLDQAKAILRRIRETILSNEMLRTSMPSSNREAVWTKTSLQLKNGSIIWARPNNQNIVGEHVDWIGGDETGYWTDYEVADKYIPPMVLAKQGKVVFIGTPTSDTDLIHHLMKNKAYVSKLYPSNLKDATTGLTLLEMRYPGLTEDEVKKLVAMEHPGSLSWSREFLLKPLSNKDKIYPFDLIKNCFNFDAAFTNPDDVSFKRNESAAYYMGLDFALSGEAGSDWTVYTILAKTGDECHLTWMERYKGLSYQAQKSRIFKLAEKFKPTKIAADEGTFGKAFIQDVKSEGHNVEPFHFTNEFKQNLHTNLRNMLEQRRIIISYSEEDDKTKQTVDLLLKEFDKFGVTVKDGLVKFEGLGEHDDMVTSLALAAWVARGTSNVSWHVERGSVGGEGGTYYLGKVN